MTFKEKIVRLRKIKGLTQDEFASAVGVSRQAVYKWESGQSYPEVQKLIEIKMLFGISIDDLLDDTYEVQMPEKKRKKRAPVQKNENAVEENAGKAAPVSNIEKNSEDVKAEENKAEEKKPVEEIINITEENTAIEESTTESVTENATESAEDIVAENNEEAVITPVAEEEVKEEESVSEDTASDKKKRGFFSRMFSKK